MKYKVVHQFRDLQDNMHQYHVGDEYPRRDFVASKKRIAELSSTTNKMRRVLIEAIEEPIKDLHLDEIPVEEKPRAKKNKKK